jgi:hypothetical protein
MKAYGGLAPNVAAQFAFTKAIAIAVGENSIAFSITPYFSL